MMYKSAYEGARRRLALLLMDAGAVLTSNSIDPAVEIHKGPGGLERGFKFKLHEKKPSAPLSPLKFNLRTAENPNPGPLTREIVDLAARCMRNVQLHEAKVGCDGVVGVPHAGDPFAEALAGLANIPHIQLNKYEYRDRRCIASLKTPIPMEIQRVLLVDDVITHADSKREAILNLRESGLEVTHVIVLIDHEMGGREELAKHACELNAVFTCSELLDWYVESGRITRGVRTDFNAFRAAVQT